MEKSEMDKQLEILKRKTEMIANAMSGSADAPKTKGKQKGTRGKGERMSEEQEDRELLDKEIGNAGRQVRVLVQPSIIVAGKMRDYQLEVKWISAFMLSTPSVCVMISHNETVSAS